MSADNEIAILEMTDKDGHKEYRVADNVSMSYNILGPDIDLSVHWQGPIVHNIWKEATVFYHQLDAYEYSHLLEESGYYEYGTGSFRLNGSWEDVVKAKDENECLKCKGHGFIETEGTHYQDKCLDCKGSGLKKGFPHDEIQ